ncbi:MAG: flagellar M-ring protein FliF [Bdellovibrionales bacterium]|nr:flagellar M-ring protein FliF [Bdellovibrionales bacterium]
MKFDIGAIFGQLVSLYVKLPLAQKIAIPLLVAGSMFVIVFVSKWANEADYAVLYSGLEEGDAAAVVERLKDQRIGYRLRDEGRTIEITPPKLVHELRLEMAAAGIPQGGKVGFELFDETKLGQTGFVEKLKFVRALQGELERTIEAIDAVRDVRIHITSPKQSVFVKRDVLPTASVLVRLKAGMQLSKEQVMGIANLVANSVERLTPENVTIIDSKGAILNEHRDDEDFGGADPAKLEFKRALESNLARNVETMLTEVLGPGRAVARVTADLDFGKYEREEEAYDPGGQVVRSSRTVRETAGLTAQGGVPGVVSNLTNDPGLLTPPDSAENTNGRSETVTNYEVSRAVSRTVSETGTVKKLSVAVLVDGQYVETPAAAPDPAQAEAQKLYQPLSAEMMRKIENLVKQSVGYDPTRGDVVTVENIPFFQADDSLESLFAEAESREQIKDWIQMATPALLILLLFFLVKPLVRFLVSPTEAEVDLSRLLPAGIEELEAELDAERARLTSAQEMIEPTVDIEELEELLAENSKLVKENPQQAALLIRYWLNDGRV